MPRPPAAPRTAILLPLLACLFAVSAQEARAEGGPVNVGYLVDESFSFLLKTPDDRNLASGWDIGLGGGTVAYSYNSHLRISDTSTTQPVTLYRKFVTQTAGTVTLEFRFKPSTVIDGLQWQLRSDTVAPVQIITVGNELRLLTSTGTSPQWVSLGTYAANGEYGIKVVANIDTDRSTVYVNGALKANAATFSQPVGKLNGFFMQTGAASTGALNFTPVKVYKGYAVNETFISTMTNLPADWQVTNSGGTVAVEQNNSATKPDVYSLKLNGAASTSGVSLSKTVPAQAEDQVFQFKTLIPTKTDGLVFELRSGTTSAVKLTTAGGQFAYINGSGTAVPFYNYRANVWYALRVKVRPSTDRADIYLNGKLLVSNAPFAAPVTSVDSLRFFAPAGTGKLMWVDDVQLYRDYPLPADYVPAPVAVSSSTQRVGVQSCSMWREGNHLGWDTINPYPERTPLLGFYDEGSPETADWEIKWKVEHGIDFELYCWFRPRGNEGLPIKDPYLGQALHDGYFNARYSNAMSFAIMWENYSSFASNTADFENNMVPYWIEYYFKDPRYLKIDNKPVLSIYNLELLIQQFGSLATVQNEIAFLRSAVRAAGFADIILITPSNATDSGSLNQLSSAGFDAIYAYSFGAAGSRIGLQQQTLTAQRNTGAIDVMATLSMGRDDTPWRGISGYWTSVSEFNALAQWAVNSFVPSLPTGSIGRKLVMLDNWNEYGEGHFLMPTGLNGFGYLDSLRGAFTAGGLHAHTLPTQAQKNRINVLYPSDRQVETVWSRPSVTETYSKRWEFNTAGNSEGWSPIWQVGSVSVTGGSYTGTATGNDPSIKSGDQLGLDAARASYLQIRMSSSAETTGQVFFITQVDDPVTGWSEEKSVKFYIGPNGGNPTVFHVPMFENPTWAGTIRQLRFDMMATPGTFAIDHIRAVDSTGQVAGANMILDPGFESSFPYYSGWQVTLQMSTAEHRTGAQAIKVNKTDPYGSIQFPVEVKKGKAYYYSAWAKLPPGATAGQKLRLGLQYNLDGARKQIIMLTGPSLTTAWSQVSGTYTLEEAGLVSNVTLLVYTDSPAYAEPVYLDDLEVKPDLITDPGFEGSVPHYSGWEISQQLTTAERHSGAQALQVTKTHAYGSVQFPLEIAKGVAYHYSAWAKLAAGSTPGEVLRLGLQYKLDGVQKQLVMHSSPGLSTTAWSQAQGTYTITETGVVTDVVLLIFTDAPAAADSYYLDDVNVRKAL
ncbi:carbohydrate binding domain-containing protein [Pyxidicoccus sp. 3LFB2]